MLQPSGRLLSRFTAVPFSWHFAAAALLLAAGAALRLYALGDIPAGPANDEATAAYESWALLHYGIDKNGVSWPVHFVQWGAGQNALYSYLAMPFIALGGLNEVAFRLPMALAGAVALFLLWRVGERAGGRGFGLLLLLLLALSSWHITATRWALESNLLPFTLLLSVYLLTRGDNARLLVQAAGVFALALSVYAYGTAYALAPLLVVLVFLWLRLNRLADGRRLLLLAFIAFITALPIMLLVVINAFNLETIEVLGVSIPRYTGSPRYGEVSLLFGGAGRGFFANIGELAALLAGFGDNEKSNALPGFGALPPLAILLSCFALGVVLYRAKTKRDYGVHLLAGSWFLAALLTAAITEVELHRINALWLPALYLMGLGVWLLYQRRREFLYLLAAFYVAYSGVFLYQYFRDYARVSAGIFRSGMGAAIERAVAAAGDEVIYVSSRPHIPAIYPMFYTQTPPGEYLDSRIVGQPNNPFYYTLAYGQFLFVSPLSSQGLDNLDPFLTNYNRPGLDKVAGAALRQQGIDLSRVAHYVLLDRELAEIDRSGLVTERFGRYYYAYDPAVAAAGALRGPLLRVDKPAVTEMEMAAARDNFAVYREGRSLTYYKEGCDASDTRERFFLHLFPASVADLAAERRAQGFANQDFEFDRYGALYGRNCWAVVPLPDYPIASIRTGQFGRWRGNLWQAEFAVGE